MNLNEALPVKVHPKMRKAVSERIHAERRFEERYDIDLNQKLREELINLIKNGKTKKSYKQKYKNTFSRTIHEIVLYGRKILIVFDEQTYEIVTCLPKNGTLYWKDIRKTA